MRRLLIILMLFWIVLPSTAEADIILEVSDDGVDLTLQWTGELNNGGLTGSLNTQAEDLYRGGSDGVFSLDGSSRAGNNLGTVSPFDPWITEFGRNAPTQGSGSGFGFEGSSLIWDDAFGDSPGMITPTRSWIFSGLTIATAFGTNLDSGPVLLWTHKATGDTVSVARANMATVPEPSMTGIGLCCLCCTTRRRRRI